MKKEIAIVVVTVATAFMFAFVLGQRSILWLMKPDRKEVR